ncbi:MAG: hypothetical protein FWE31_04600 [Firmicutes bacterium]|nr:hypothetical protein [Bacillota bacterium]
MEENWRDKITVDWKKKMEESKKTFLDKCCGKECHKVSRYNSRFDRYIRTTTCLAEESKNAMEFSIKEEYSLDLRMDLNDFVNTHKDIKECQVIPQEDRGTNRFKKAIKVGRNCLIVAGLIFGLGSCMSSCIERSNEFDANRREEQRDVIRDNVREELETIHIWWAENGSTCDDKERCVAEGLEKLGRMNYTRDARHSVLERSEIRHAGLVEKE